MGKANLARDLTRVLGAVLRIDHATLGSDEAQRQLEIQQRAVVRLVDASGRFRGLVDLVDDRGEAVELRAWQRMARRLEVHHAGLPRVDQISDLQVPDVESGEVVHFSDPRRIGAWIEHAVAVIDLLVELCAAGDGEAPAHEPLTDGAAFGAAAQALEALSAAWTNGDTEIVRMLRGGMEPGTGGYEQIVRFVVRAPVEAQLVLLRSTLVPIILPQCDASLRDRVQRFLHLADLGQYVPDRYGEETARWRQTWVATGLQVELDELVPMLRASAESRRSGAFEPVSNRSAVEHAANGREPSGSVEAQGPAVVRAKAVYDFAWETMPEVRDMSIAELYAAVRDKLELMASKAKGEEAERWSELLDGLPDRADTFARYLRRAGVRRYDKAGVRKTRTGGSVRRSADM